MRFILSLLLFASGVFADVTLPRLLSDGAVLQRGIPARIWGKAEPGESVTVTFRNQKKQTRADEIGRWSVYLDPLEAGGPDTLTVAGRNTITLHDLLAGDVWVASGQSNMEFPVERANDATKEIAAAQFPRLRLFNVARKVSTYPLDDVDATGWKPCTPESVRTFSAVAYFFGRQLLDRLNVPIGVIAASWGGTPAESWTSGPALTADPSLIVHLNEWEKEVQGYVEASARSEMLYARAVAKASAEGKRPPARPWRDPAGPGHPWTPAGLFNAMLAPLTPYAIRGAIWYQGESNAGRPRAPYYNRLFETMIRDWRRAWGQGDFPFLFVQLANYKTAEGSMWPELREAQLQTLALKNTGMAVTIDIGDPADIHPRNKQEVGRRLALAARAIAYGEDIEYSGPVFRQATREQGAIRLWFDHAARGLQARGGELKGFEIAGVDRKFVPAIARIEGATVIVSSAETPDPVAVRYAWRDDPECTLFNSEGLPATPFRTGVR